MSSSDLMQLPVCAKNNRPNSSVGIPSALGAGGRRFVPRPRHTKDMKMELAAPLKGSARKVN